MTIGLILRFASGIVFVPVLILMARAGGAVWLGFINVLVFLALNEFYKLMAAKGVDPSRKLGVTIGLVLVATTYWFGLGLATGFFLTATILTITIRELGREQLKFPIYDISTTIFGVMYVAWLLLHLLLLRELPLELGLPYEIGGSLALYVFFMTWACDTGAYLVGRVIGRHKLMPRVSPKKSIEGSVAGFLSSTAAGVIGPLWFVRDAQGLPLLSTTEAILLGAAVGILGQVGDLVESLLKRDAQIKDSSDTIPGHGGILDRFDSLMFTAPFAYYFLRYVVLR